jgi:hypothetical protein
MSGARAPVMVSRVLRNRRIASLPARKEKPTHVTFKKTTFYAIFGRAVA